MTGIILNNISDCYIGNNQVDSIWMGSTKIWPTGPGPGPGPHDYSQDYLTIESLSNSNNIFIRSAFSYNNITIDYSTDNGTTWNSLTTSTSSKTIATLNYGDKLLLKGTSAPSVYYDNVLNYNRIYSSGQYNLSGNIMSLLYGDNFIGKTTLSTDYVFSGLFTSSSYLVSAEYLILPATTLSNHCYEDMFRSCTNLTIPPELPAILLTPNCYSGMFLGCTNLMVTPELPAPTLAQNCYVYMFNGCTSISSIKCYATTNINSSYLFNWLLNVAATGTFYKDANATYPSGESGIPSGWTVVNI